jgi:hypothetical protein
MSMRPTTGIAGLLTGVLACAIGNPALAADDEWQQTMVVYIMGAALDGDAYVGPLQVPVDLSISDVFDSLEFGAMAAYRVANDTWSFTGDFTFMGLGGTGTSPRLGLIKGDVDLDQTTFMATVGRRLNSSLEALFSLGYVDLSTDVKVTSTGPQGLVNSKVSTSADWIDPLIGLQYNVPFADDWRFNLRGDVGGFGVGADLTYQLLANLRWHASDRFGVAFGYRLIAFDYEDGKKDGASYQRYDLVEQGPFVGVTVDF